MELNDALRRIVGQHWRLLAVCVVCGLALAVLFAPHGKLYSASARLVLDTPDPVARQQSEAIADTAKGITQSPSLVRSALRKAGADRGDPAVYAMHNVSVTALGSSGVLELSVRDEDSRVAASVANALSSLLIRTRLKVTNGKVEQVFADLDQRTTDLSRKIANADADVNALTLQIAQAALSPQLANQLRAKRDAAVRRRDFYVQERSVLESERVSLLAENAQRPRPSIISVATPPSQPEAAHRIVYLVLGVVLGLILGVGAAGILETVRPTLVGSDMLAGELDAAVLGTLPAGAAATSAASSIDIGARLLLAAEAAAVGNVALLAAGPDVDLDRLAQSLNSSAAAAGTSAHPNAYGHMRTLRVGRFRPESPPVNNGTRSGLVLVSPTALKKAELGDIAHLLKVSQLPLLGVITYPRSAAGHLGVKQKFARVKAV